MKVKIINAGGNPLPKYATAGSAGMDLYAAQDVVVYPKTKKATLVETGIKIQLPVGYEAQIRPRSGMSVKRQLIIPNAPGTIDSDYTGHVMVAFRNLSDEPILIEKGERIAQMVVAKYENVEWEQVESEKDFESTERGAGGFGSTGTK